MQCSLSLTFALGVAVAAGCTRSGYSDFTTNASDGDAGTTAYRQSVLADAPLAYYRFDEPDGSTVAIDLSGSGHDGTFVGSPIFGVPGALATDSNPSICFDGDTYVKVNLPTVDTTDGAQTTVEFWMRWNGNPNRMPVAFGTYNLWLKTNDLFGFNTNRSDIWGVRDAKLAHRWHHVVAIFHNGDTRNNRLYLDGNEQTLQPVAGSFPKVMSVESRFRIGRYDSEEEGGYKFTGLIDEVAVYTGALAPKRVSAHYLAASQ